MKRHTIAIANFAQRTLFKACERSTGKVKTLQLRKQLVPIVTSIFMVPIGIFMVCSNCPQWKNGFDHILKVSLQVMMVFGWICHLSNQMVTSDDDDDAFVQPYYQRSYVCQPPQHWSRITKASGAQATTTTLCDSENYFVQAKLLDVMDQWQLNLWLLLHIAVVLVILFITSERATLKKNTSLETLAFEVTSPLKTKIHWNCLSE